MASEPLLAPPQYAFRIALSDDLCDLYQSQADRLNIPIEQILRDRLRMAVTFVDSKPLYFDDADRQDLEALLGKNLANARDALQTIRRYLTVKVEGVSIKLKPTLLARLKSRCFVADFGKWLTNIIVEELERYCGMR